MAKNRLLDAVRSVFGRRQTKVNPIKAALRLERLEDRTVPTGPGSLNATYVNGVYNALLFRDADPVGLAYFSGLLDLGVSRPQVVLGIEHTPEFNNVLVTELYGLYLNRLPDSGGLAAWSQFLQSGGSVSQVASSILASPEFFQANGGTNSGFLDALYEDVLNRPIDATAQAAFTQQLSVGVTRLQIATFVSTSLEADFNVVETLYGQFLGRTADTGGLNAWTSQLVNGAPVQSVIAGIVGSDEYFQDVTTPPPSSPTA